MPNLLLLIIDIPHKQEEYILQVECCTHLKWCILELKIYTKYLYSLADNLIIGINTYSLYTISHPFILIISYSHHMQHHEILNLTFSFIAFTLSYNSKYIHYTMQAKCIF